MSSVEVNENKAASQQVIIKRGLIFLGIIIVVSLGIFGIYKFSQKDEETMGTTGSGIEARNGNENNPLEQDLHELQSQQVEPGKPPSPKTAGQLTNQPPTDPSSLGTETTLSGLSQGEQTTINNPSQEGQIASNKPPESGPTTNPAQNTPPTIDKKEEAVFKAIEHYHGIIVKKILGACFDADEVRQAFDSMLATSKTLTQAKYGAITKVDDLDDFKMATIVDKRFIQNRSFQSDADKKTLLGLIKNGNFRIYAFSEEQLESILFAEEAKDYTIAGHFFKSLDSESKITGPKEPFLKAYGEFALARKNYITREFTTQKDADDAYAQVMALLQAAASLDSDGKAQFERIYGEFVPKVTAPGQVPLICAVPDAKFNNGFTEYLQDPENPEVKLCTMAFYMEAVDGCAAYSKFMHVGIDGSPVPFNAFYTGTFNDFNTKLINHAVTEIKKLSPKDRNDVKNYSFPLGSLVNFKPTILALASA